MDDGQISAKRLFLYYAYPCVPIREKRGLISPEDVLKLETLIFVGGDPTPEELKRCFPHAVSSFMKFTNIFWLSDPWPVEKVREFWRVHKGRVKACDVMRGVIDLMADHFLIVNCDGVLVEAENEYEFSLTVGDTVYLHHNIVAEVIEK